jgi:hypothetical protein
MEVVNVQSFTACLRLHGIAGITLDLLFSRRVKEDDMISPFGEFTYCLAQPSPVTAISNTMLCGRWEVGDYLAREPTLSVNPEMHVLETSEKGRGQRV